MRWCQSALLICAVARSATASSGSASASASGSGSDSGLSDIQGHPNNPKYALMTPAMCREMAAETVASMHNFSVTDLSFYCTTFVCKPSSHADYHNTCENRAHHGFLSDFGHAQARGPEGLGTWTGVAAPAARPSRRGRRL